MRIYICENNHKNLIETRKVLLKAIDNSGLEVQIVASTYIPQNLIQRLEAAHMGVYIIALDSDDNFKGIEIGRLIRRIDPRGFIIMIVESTGECLRVIESNIEVLDLIVRDGNEIISELENCLRYIESRSEVHGLC